MLRDSRQPNCEGRNQTVGGLTNRAHRSMSNSKVTSTLQRKCDDYGACKMVILSGSGIIKLSGCLKTRVKLPVLTPPPYVESLRIGKKQSGQS